MAYCTQADILLQVDEPTLVQLTTDDVEEETVSAYDDASSLTLSADGVYGDTAAERLANVQRITVELVSGTWTEVSYSAVSAATPAVITITPPGATHALKNYKVQYIPVPAVDDDIVDRAIADADEEIDAYVGGRYSLPFSSTPNLIRKYSVDIAIYNLFSRRRGAPPDRKDRYERAVAFLKDVAAGKAVLDVPDPGNDSDDGVGVSTVKTDRLFSKGRTSDGSAGTLDNY